MHYATLPCDDLYVTRSVVTDLKHRVIQLWLWLWGWRCFALLMFHHVMHSEFRELEIHLCCSSKQFGLRFHASPCTISWIPQACCYFGWAEVKTLNSFFFVDLLIVINECSWLKTFKIRCHCGIFKSTLYSQMFVDNWPSQIHVFFKHPIPDFFPPLLS